MTALQVYFQTEQDKLHVQYVAQAEKVDQDYHADMITIWTAQQKCVEEIKEEFSRDPDAAHAKYGPKPAEPPAANTRTQYLRVHGAVHPTPALPTNTVEGNRVQPHVPFGGVPSQDARGNKRSASVWVTPSPRPILPNPPGRLPLSAPQTRSPAGQPQQEPVSSGGPVDIPLAATSGGALLEQTPTRPGGSKRRKMTSDGELCEDGDDGDDGEDGEDGEDLDKISSNGSRDVRPRLGPQHLVDLVSEDSCS